MTDAAWDKYQEHLDFVSEALWAERYEDVASRMHYPHSIACDNLVQRIDSPAELVDTARIARASMTRVGGTAYHRVCLEASFDPTNDAVIHGRHRTFLLRGGTYVIDPYESDMTLRRGRGGIWLGAGVIHGVAVATITTLDPSRARRIAQ